MKHPRTLPPVVVTTLVTLLLALHWWLGVSATMEMSSTSDELAHVTGGFSYGKFGDYRLQPENGSVPQRLAALPWLAAGAQMDHSDNRVWGASNVWLVGHRFFYNSGNNTDYLLLLSRATMALLGVALGGLIFAWSRRLWGDAGGLVSLGLYAFCPNFLANAPLATSDVAMTLCLLAACGALWWQMRRLNWKTGLLSVAITALACVTKFSFGLLVPIFALMVMIRLWSDEPLTVALGAPRRIVTWRGKLAVFLASGLVHGVAAWILIWACFGFRFSAVGPGMPPQVDFFAPWSILLPGLPAWRTFFEVTRGWHLLPDAFLEGFGYVLYAAAERGAFLNGRYSSTGWPQFFPYAFLVKTPWPQLIAFALAGGVTAAAWWRARAGSPIWRRMQADLYRVTPLVLLFAVYWASSLSIHLNIGLRHILPTYPVLFIGAGVLARPAAGRWRLVAAGLVLWTAAESAIIRPHYLAYFNLLAGGPQNGWRHLVDSSLDWGQDLPGLTRWLRREARPGEQVYVSYFGSGDFDYEGIRARQLAPIYNFGKPLPWYELGPGIYCVGATMLQGVYNSWHGEWTLGKERSYVTLRALLGQPPPSVSPADRAKYSAQLAKSVDQLRFARLCQYLRVRRPDAVIGYSIFIYRLNSAEIHAATQGSMSELAAVMEQAILAQE